MLQQQKETNTLCISYKAEHTSNKAPTSTGKQKEKIPFYAVPLWEIIIQLGFKIDCFVQILLLNIQKEKRHGPTQKRMSAFCMCRKLECKQDDMKSFCKMWSDRRMYWITVINMNFQNTEVSSQSSTLQAFPPPTHLWDQKEQGKGGSRGREETQAFWELGIAGIVSKPLTSDDEAWITEQMCNREKPQNRLRDRMLIVRQIRGDKYLNIHETLIRSFGWKQKWSHWW